ncbi:MAG: glycosyltransferase [Candidatus Peribacteraceae bacterium]|nr:glycosyltransferase [Candidatus Peribacteraceae bacterium]
MKRSSEQLSNKTLECLLKDKSNDYSHIEKEFNCITGQSLMQIKSFSLPKKWKRMGISIIIPTFNSNNSLIRTLSRIENACIDESGLDVECIVVDDASLEPVSELLDYFQDKFELQIIRNATNMGAGFSRALGAKNAKNEILIFLDSDVVPTRNFFTNHAYIHYSLPDDLIAMASFREKVESKDERLDTYPLKISGVDTSNDFRVSTLIKPIWTNNTILHNRKTQLLKETDNWKKFGNNVKCGIWTLPMMGLTCALSCRKSLIDSVNFQPQLFKGWGFEDIAMCATMIARGAYIIPNFNSAVLHVKHHPRSGSEKLKAQEFLRNREQYNRLLNSKPSFL